MIAYVDSSVLLRVVLGQRGALKEWKQIETGVVSVLVEVECLRTLDRLRYQDVLSDDEVATRRDAVYRVVAQMEVVEPTTAILRRASQPLPVPLGIRDAIHLATAAAWCELRDKTLTVATHDRALGTAARASGFSVVGL